MGLKQSSYLFGWMLYAYSKTFLVNIIFINSQHLFFLDLGVVLDIWLVIIMIAAYLDLITLTQIG